MITEKLTIARVLEDQGQGLFHLHRRQEMPKMELVLKFKKSLKMDSIIALKGWEQAQTAMKEPASDSATMQYR